MLRHPLGRFGAALLAVALVVGMVGLVWTPHNPEAVDLMQPFRPPFWSNGGSWSRPFGTDALGRDVLSRLMAGTGLSLLIAASALALASTVGTALGLIAGYARGAVDAVIMRLIDVLLAFPFLLFAIAAVAMVGPSVAILIIVLAVRATALFARTVRAATLVEASKLYADSARVVGVPAPKIVFGHILPNVMSPILVIASFEFASCIIAEASLGFLGLGVRPPRASLGGLMADARQYIVHAPWLGIVPGVMLILIVLGANTFGDGLRDVLDPRLRQ